MGFERTQDLLEPSWATRTPRGRRGQYRLVVVGILFGDPGTIKRSPETCLMNPVVEPQGRADPRSLCGARRRA